MSPLPLVVLFALLAAPPAPSAKEKEREQLRRAITGVIERSPLRTARISVQVRSLEDGSVVFSQGADELLNPASNVKLFTAAAALARLGPDYRFETEFLTDHDFKDGKTRTLYVRGRGDPTLSTDRLYGIVSELLHAGLKEVGDVVVDDSWFDAQREAPGFDQETGDRAYLAPTGALSLNWNTLGIYLRPADREGAPATAELEPPSEYFTLESHLRTGSKTQRRFVVGTELDKDRIHQKVTVSGYVPVEKGTWSVWKKVEQPALYFGFTLKALLAQRGVKVKGRLRSGLVPPAGTKTLYIAASETLDIVLKRMNKHSSNFVAEQLIKTLGAEGKGPPGSTARGIEVVEEFLERDVGMRRGSYVMRNGSGLNDTNRFSAAQHNVLLKYMWDRFPLAPEFMSSLGIAGKDGTIKYRFEGTDAVWRLRAKTGTLENVSALSGYVQGVGGERFVFSVLVNDFPGRVSTVLQHIDAVGGAVAATGSTGGPSSALAALTPTSVVGPMEELKSRMRTYAALAVKADKRNGPFLRTSWRNEKDPAVRAVIAEALYQSDAREFASTRMLLESVSAGDEVYGRLKRAAKELGIETPLVGSVVELAAGGSGEALARLYELTRASNGDEAAEKALSDALATVATEAPRELLLSLKSAPSTDRDATLESLADGLVRAAKPDAPLWGMLKELQGSPDANTVDFARMVEVTLSLKIAEAKAPVATDGGLPITAPPMGLFNSQPAPGG
ncbi:MAG: D-alanyl-D-alanine carboxypeptidase [Myxococcaceae bacterium]|nr:D-alanyl-D-alanine carboxypeptidase [Myxococcaceae bacterium]